MGIEFRLHQEFHITGIRICDPALMHVLSRAGYTGDDLERLNIVRRFYGFLHVSCVVLCDGVTLDPVATSRQHCKSLQHTFPYEQPRRKDFKLWEDALLSITTTGGKIIFGVGEFLAPPHRELPWYASSDGTLLYFEFVRHGVSYYRV